MIRQPRPLPFPASPYPLIETVIGSLVPVTLLEFLTTATMTGIIPPNLRLRPLKGDGGEMIMIAVGAVHVFVRGVSGRVFVRHAP